MNNVSWEAELEVDYPSLALVRPATQGVLVTVFSLTAALSLSGNLTVILVLSLGRRSSTELKAFLINLAVSDVAMAIFSIPFTYTMFLLGRWIFEPWFCPIAMAMQHSAVLVSVYTLTAIGIDRYKAIVDPLGRRASSSRNGLIITFIWVFALSIASVQLYVSRATTFWYDRQWNYKCEELWPTEEHSKIYTVFVFLVTFVIPLSCLTYTYLAVACKLWRSSAPGNADPARDTAQLRAKWKFQSKWFRSSVKYIILNVEGVLNVIKMLVTIVILFSICWLPLQIFLFLFYFKPGFGTFHTENEKYQYALSYFFCLWLANANSFVNPLVYSFMSDNFRSDVKEIFRRMVGFSKQEDRLSARSYTRTTLCQDSSVRSSKYIRRESPERSMELFDYKNSSHIV